MKYLFDSSSIFRAIKEGKIEFLNGNYTLELARYELGNILRKDYSLQAKVSGQEFKNVGESNQAHPEFNGCNADSQL